MKYLITGGTGSFGRRFAAHVLNNGDEAVVFSRNELKQLEMKAEFPDARYIIGDVRDRRAIFDACRDVDYVVHAAALKHVATGENQPFEVVLTNLLGTKNVVDAANITCANMVLISTDKAVEPVNAYGASKMLAERLTIDGGQRVVRYGNVFGSSGSILHIFKKLYADGHKFKVTDERMTRFIITFEQAIQLTETALHAKPGSHTIPKLKSMNITDLARAFDADAEIEIIGIQEGEKLAEKLTPEYSSADAPKYTVDEIRGLIDACL